MLSFDDFIKTHASCSVIKGSNTARCVYEDIIWKEQNRIKMAELSASKIPALSACVKQIEAFCLQPGSDLDLTDETVRKVIGRMAAVALKPLGLEPTSKKRLPQSAEAGIFKNAACYSNTGAASEKIEKRIVPITK